MVAFAEKTQGRTGCARLEVEMVFHESNVTAALARSPMKLLTPVARGRSVWAYTSSFGGGLVAGDCTQLDVQVRGGARCFLGTQSSTKVYRNPSALPCEHTTHATVTENGMLVFAPEPVQAFAEAHYSQRQEFHLSAKAGLVLLDWFSSGRAARGERWAFEHLESRNDVFVEGQRILVDAVHLESEELAEQMGRFNCFATLLLIGPELKATADQILERIRTQPVSRRATLNVSASPVRHGILLRLAGEQVEMVRNELREHLNFLGGMLGDDPWERKW